VQLGCIFTGRRICSRQMRDVTAPENDMDPNEVLSGACPLATTDDYLAAARALAAPAPTPRAPAIVPKMAKLNGRIPGVTAKAMVGAVIHRMSPR
jgi:hypothetical protein